MNRAFFRNALPILVAFGVVVALARGHANDTLDPATLYSTQGIVWCEDNTIAEKGDRANAVTLLGDDREASLGFLKPRVYKDIVAMLYTHRPEAEDGRPGNPALVVLLKEGGRYCVHAIFSSNVPLFQQLEDKYGSRVRNVQ